MPKLCLGNEQLQQPRQERREECRVKKDNVGVRVEKNRIVIIRRITAQVLATYSGWLFIAEAWKFISGNLPRYSVGFQPARMVPPG